MTLSFNVCDDPDHFLSLAQEVLPQNRMELIDWNFLRIPGAMPSMTKTMEPRVTSAVRKPSTPKRSAGPDVAGVTKGSSVAPASRSATAKTPGRPSRTRTGVVQFAGTNARFTPAQKRELIPIKSFSEFGTKGT